jgi:DNA-binding response OmpR family regulator
VAELLIVDDNVDLAELLAEGLRRGGHHVRIAANGEAGLAELACARPDAILLDVEMPILDGPGMACEILLRDAGLEKIPIALVSGMVDLPVVAARVGTPYYLGKPYSFAAIFALCERVLKERVPPVRAIA